MKGRILIMDSEAESTNLAIVCLQQEGYDVCRCCDTEEALLWMTHAHFDLAIVDLAQLGLSGGRFCRRLREKYGCQVLLLAAQTDATSVWSRDLVWGATGYVAKPIRPHALSKQVAELFQQVPQPEDGGHRLSCGGLTIDRERHLCLLDGRSIPLTPLEFEILWLLAVNRGRVLSAEELFCRIWSEPYLNGINTLMVHIRHLREKLGETPQQPRFIRTVRGVGYVLEAPENIS